MNKIDKRKHLALQVETVRLLSAQALTAVGGAGATVKNGCYSAWADQACPNTAYTYCITRCTATSDLSDLCTIP